ncbi:MAG: leucine-rich repeat domain-containing protein [Lachnospiraceae bacterium]|nr:leucine-rich repeat domain-containing protein [Lachnospiraceae bacterium]
MQIKELDTQNGVLQFEIRGEDVIVTGYRGKDISVTVPTEVENKAVTIIGKKAFLGCKDLQELILPETIKEIQEWAFACCSHLEKITLPRKKIIIGQGILKDCHKLQQICLTNGVAQTDIRENLKKNDSEQDVSFLLAATMNKLDAFYLFDLLTAGTKDWMEQWDARMLFLMEQEDMEGYSKMLLCGEEDYGSKENNLDYYTEQRRRAKVRLAMLRLFHDTGLTQENRKKLLEYIQSHKKGETSEETWKVVLEEHGDEKEYYQFLIDTDCITQENFDAMLEDMGDYHTEMKAFLMNYQSTNLEKDDIFASLEFEL